MANKMYALYVRMNEGCMWSNAIAVSDDIDKLTVFMLNDSPIMVGSCDITNSPNVVRFKVPEGKFPHYKIQGIPYVV